MKIDFRLLIIGGSIAIAILTVLFILMIFSVGENKTNNDENETEEIIYDKKIESINIKYYEGYSFSKGEELNNKIPQNTINLESENLNEVSQQISEIKGLKSSAAYDNIKVNYICDSYKLEINDDFTIYIGEKYGIVGNNKIYFEVPEELYKKLSEIVKKYNEENLYKKINADKITIIKKEEKLELTDKEQIERISNFEYYVVNSKEEDYKKEEPVYKLDLNDGRILDIYKASVVGCMNNKDGSKEYIMYKGSLWNYVKNIFENR